MFMKDPAMACLRLPLYRKQRLTAVIVISFSFFIAELIGMPRNTPRTRIVRLTIPSQLDSERDRWRSLQMHFIMPVI